MYPDLEFDYFWETTVFLSSWAGFQIRRGKYGSVSSPEKSDGKIKVIFLNATDKDQQPGTEEKAKIDWLLKNQTKIIENALDSLYREYSYIQHEWKEFHGDKAAEKLPDLKAAEELKLIIGEPTIHLHKKIVDQRYYIGISASCSWEQEHGVGWLMLGTETRICDNSDVALYEWMIDQDAEKLMS